jgi:nucleoside-diphosphate-sugar epimerase
VARAEPDVVIHQMTSIPRRTDMKRFDEAFGPTIRLRTEGTDHLVEAARAAGAGRIVAQSFGNWTYARTGGPVKTEEDPFDPDPPASMRRSLEAIRHLESAVLDADGIEGVVLRYANLYGPGTSWSEGGELLELVHRRRLPLIGDGAGVWSFVHVDDAASATVVACHAGAPGVYNVADDEPAPAAVWLPALAEAVGAGPPRRVPAWIGRLAAGEAGVSMFTRIRGASNERAKRELGWRPRHPSWRAGFREGPAGALPQTARAA